MCLLCSYYSIVPGIFGNQQKQHLDSIKQMLHSCLIDQSNAQVCLRFFHSTDGSIVTMRHYINHMLYYSP